MVHIGIIPSGGRVSSAPPWYHLLWRSDPGSNTPPWYHILWRFDPRLLANAQNLSEKLLLYSHDGESSYPSTAYGCTPPPCICIWWIMEPFHVGVEPQPHPHGIISCGDLTMILSKNTKSVLTNVGIRYDGESIYPSTAYELSHSPCISIWWIWEPFHMGVEPHLHSHGIICCGGLTQNVSDFPKSFPTSVGVQI
jgi:hypothetical protein